MKKIVLLILIAGWATDARGCFNVEAYELKDGSILYTDEEGMIVPHGHTLHLHNFDLALFNLDTLWIQTKDVAYLSDYALVLAFKKQYEESARIYLEIEEKYPGRYSTASNLGTVYELMGQNENALQWISKAVAIDPESHFGSEWLHVNILKAKIQGDTAVNSRFLLGAEFGDGLFPSTKLDGEKLISLRNALYYQLNERVTFVEPKDRIVAILLFDLANIAWLTGERRDAFTVYEKAKAYGMEGNIFFARYNLAGIRFSLVNLPEKYGDLILFTLVGLCFFGMAIFGKIVNARPKRKK